MLQFIFLLSLFDVCVCVCSSFHVLVLVLFFSLPHIIAAPFYTYEICYGLCMLFFLFNQHL